MTVDLIPAATAGTLFGLLSERARRSREATAYRQFDKATGAWGDVSWTEVVARTDRFAGSFRAAGLQRGDRVAILLANGLDWVCFDMAAHKLGLPVVPLYTNDAVANTGFLIGDSAPRVVLLDTAARWRAVAGEVTPDRHPEQIWLHEPPTAETVPGPPVGSLAEVLDADGDTPTDHDSRPDDPAALIYTSGTTGAPKGAVLTHRALLANAEGVAKIFPPLREDVFFSILPLAHGFERTMGYLLPVMAGSCVAHAPSLMRLRQDLAKVRPTAIMGVPRLYESIHSSARRAAAASALRLKLYDMTARIGWQRFAARAGLGPGPSLLDSMLWPILRLLVARKVTAAFGGRLRVAVSGGAAFPTEISRSLIGLGIPMVEGYGLTEAGPVVTASLTQDYVPGSVGFLLPGIEVRLTDRGELLVRSPGTMSGYWKKPGETADVLDADGWLRTGDLARLQDRRVVISGRLKHILVLSNGENVNPAPIEAALEGDPLFEQVCVAGDGRGHLSALLVLNPESWEEIAKLPDIEATDPNTASAAAVVLPRIKARLRGLSPHQQVRAYHAMFDEWTIERRLLTPTLKLRRERIIAHYADEIAALYAADS